MQLNANGTPCKKDTVRWHHAHTLYNRCGWGFSLKSCTHDAAVARRWTRFFNNLDRSTDSYPALEGPPKWDHEKQPFFGLVFLAARLPRSLVAASTTEGYNNPPMNGGTSHRCRRRREFSDRVEIILIDELSEVFTIEQAVLEAVCLRGVAEPGSQSAFLHVPRMETPSFISPRAERPVMSLCDSSRKLLPSAEW